MDAVVPELNVGSHSRSSATRTNANASAGWIGPEVHQIVANNCVSVRDVSARSVTESRKRDASSRVCGSWSNDGVVVDDDARCGRDYNTLANVLDEVVAQHRVVEPLC